jgi:hypothetical protein
MARRWRRSRIFEACACAGSTARPIAFDLIEFNGRDLRLEPIDYPLWG